MDVSSDYFQILMVNLHEKVLFVFFIKNDVIYLQFVGIS